MSFAHEKRLAARMLEVLEDGTLPIPEIRSLFEEADPVLVHVIFAWLRARYHAGHPASAGVLGRIVALCSASPTVARKARSAESDPIVEWFEESWDYREVSREDLISEIVEKLEG